MVTFLEKKLSSYMLEIFLSHQRQRISCNISHFPFSLFEQVVASLVIFSRGWLTREKNVPLRLSFNSIMEKDVWTADKMNGKEREESLCLSSHPFPCWKMSLSWGKRRSLGSEGNTSQIRQFPRDICSFRGQRECPCFLGTALRETQER